MSEDFDYSDEEEEFEIKKKKGKKQQAFNVRDFIDEAASEDEIEDEDMISEGYSDED